MKNNETNQNEGITNMVSKKDSNNKFKSMIESALTIIGVMAFAFIAALLCRNFMIKESVQSELTVGTNDAEINFYDGNFDAAISAYETMQQNEEWPIDKVKEAEAYSAKGEYTASNRLLAEAYDIRDKLIRKNGIENYEDKDKELGNLITFTALMNGDTKKALEYGEIFILDEGSYNSLDKTMFAVYLANDKKYEAQDILNNIDYDENSASEVAEISEMNMIMGDYTKGIDYLVQAFKLDKDEPKIYDVLENTFAYNKNTLISKLKDLQDENSKELSYSVFLLKCYSVDSKYKDDANKLLEKLDPKELDGIVFEGIKADIYKASGKTDEYNEIMQSIINEEDKDYYEYYLTAKYYYENKNYSDAIENAKLGIIQNREYLNTYILMTNLLTADKESEKAQGYFRTALYYEPYNYVNMIKLADYIQDVQKDADKALNYYTIASKLDSDNSLIYYDMGVCKLTLDKKEEGKDLLNKAIKLNGNVPKYYVTLANVYLQDKDNEKAIDLIRSAYSINENDIETLNSAGYYYMAVDDIDRAYTNFKSAYNDINDSTDLQIKNIVTKNYEKCKEYYDNKNKWTKSTIEDFKLID
ncbi:hypothetical protein SAMN04487886_10306 [Clostridium sp. DSM 8431]|uniref:tetratricopeptide repeat protein n=1 Tax=Clostridium sp. DSM 8431 TaxID=1761781 RepID=UPI0008E14F13|nr:hypothetical protein [Clostridium sp. DSM 8431]SFU44849.1 hypothetical protein SAMN04487886_10306 [Clostridium sp. DSM 8431]